MTGCKSHVMVLSGAWQDTHLASGIPIQQLSNVGAHIHSLQSTLEALGVNAYGEGCNPGEGAIILNPLWGTLHAPMRR